MTPAEPTDQEAAPAAPWSGGHIDRAGQWLHVVAPPGMPQQAWAVVVQETVLFAGGEERSPTMLAVPVESSAKLQRILQQPWPAGRWPWRWETEAARAADAASDTDRRVTELLTTDPQAVDTDDLDEELRSCGFERRLLSAQHDVVSRLVRARSGGNFSVPGSGKTTMTLATFALLKAHGHVDLLLVVAPLSAYEAWTTEAGDCFVPTRTPAVEVAPVVPSRSTDIVIMNYHRATSPEARAAIDGWSHGKKLMVVFDEAHRAKRGQRGTHGAAAHDVASMAGARFVLTGTPMPNDRTDLAAILDLAWPGHGPRLADPNTPFAERAWARITKRDLQLDDASVVVEKVALSPAHQTLYQAIAGAAADRTELLAAHPGLASVATMRLIAAATNPASLLVPDAVLEWPDHVEIPADQASLRGSAHRILRPAKLLRVAQYAAEHRARNEKLLIWTNFLGNVRELERMLSPWQPAVVTGSVPFADPRAPRDRTRELQRFRDDPACTALIATPQTLGEGVSLHRTCQSQIHLDRSYNAGLFLQAIDRTHRVGMPPGTKARVRVLVARDTIDEVVHRRLTRKLRRMSDALADTALRSLTLPEPDGDDSTSTAITNADVAALLSHLTSETNPPQDR